jgi:hypothetical protein
MALEATPLQETVARVIRLVRAEPLQVFIFIVMRVVLAIAVAIAVAVVFFIATLLLLIPFGGLGGVLWALMHHGDTATHVVMWCIIALLALVFFSIILAAGFMCSAVTGTFFQAYALYFLGGRYPLLGQILQPTPIPPPLPYYPNPVIA